MIYILRNTFYISRNMIYILRNMVYISGDIVYISRNTFNISGNIKSQTRLSRDFPKLSETLDASSENSYRSSERVQRTLFGARKIRIPRISEPVGQAWIGADRPRFYRGRPGYFPGVSGMVNIIFYALCSLAQGILYSKTRRVNALWCFYLWFLPFGEGRRGFYFQWSVISQK